MTDDDTLTPGLRDLLAALERMPRLGEWVEDAACAGLDTFADDKPTPDELRAFAAVCAGCPVLEDCAAYAERARPTWGVWAGGWHQGTVVRRPLPVEVVAA